MSKTIEAVAHFNELTKETQNDYYLLHKPIGTLHTKDLICRMEQKQIATHNVNGEAFVNLFFGECMQAVSEGYNVATELFHISIGIRGVVYSHNLGHNIPADQVDMRMHFVQSQEARNAVKDMMVHVAEQPASAGPVIQSVYNPVVKEPDTLNAGAMALIQGLRLAVRGERYEDIGVFFSNEDTTIQIPAEQLSPNTPSKLQFVLPTAVTPGQWMVSIATQASRNLSAKTDNIRRNEYPYPVTVL